MKTVRQRIITGILIVVGLVILALACMAFYYLRLILLYIIIAAILTMVTRPIEKRLERIRVRKKKVPRGIRALFILLSIYLVIGGFIAIFIPLFINEGKILSTVDTQQLSATMHKPIAQLETVLNSFQSGSTGSSGETSPALQLEKSSDGSPVKKGGQLSLEQYVQHYTADLLNVAQLSSLANGVVSFVGQLLLAFLIISFFTFFFIKDGPAIYEMLLLLIPAKHVQSARNIVDDTRIMLTKYFTGVLLDVLFVTTFVCVGMAIIGVKNALIIGFFAGVMNIIPYVGPLIGGAFAIVIGISTNLSLDFYSGILPLVEKIILVFVLMNLTDAFLVQPFIFSNRVKAHPIEIFAVILVAGTLAGIGGMIVAVPVYTVIRIIAREFLSKYRFVQRLTEELEEATEIKSETKD